MPFIQNTTKPIATFFSPLIITVYFMDRKLLGFGQSKWPTFILKFKASLYFCDTMPCTSHPDQCNPFKADWFSKLLDQKKY